MASLALEKDQPFPYVATGLRISIPLTFRCFLELVGAVLTSITRSCLSEDRNALADNDTVRDVDGTSHGKDNYAIGLRDCISQRALSFIIQVIDNIDFSTPSTSGITPETLSTRKGKLSGKDGPNQGREKK